MEQRATWTEERLDDLAEAMRSGFSRMDEDQREMRREIAAIRAELRTEIAAVRMDLGAEIRSLRTAMFAMNGGIIITLIGVIGAILARGA